MPTLSVWPMLRTRLCKAVCGVCLGSLLGVGLSGCEWRPNPPPPPPPPVVTTLPVPTVPVPVQPPSSAEKPPEVEAPTAPPDEAKPKEGSDSKPPAEEQAATEQAATAEGAPPTTAEVPATLPQRVLLFTEHGPCLVGLAITLDGKPLSQAFDEMAAQLQKEVDTNGDGDPTWEELLKSDLFRSGAFGNVAIANSENEKEVLRRYDLNRNGTVDVLELQRFVTRSAGGGNCFSVRGEYDLVRTSPRLAPTWKFLQGMDKGSLISRETMESAKQLLQQRDADADDRVSVSEIDPSGDMESLGMPRRAARKRLQGQMVYLIQEETDWGGLYVQLSEFYALGGELHSDRFQVSPALYQFLDENKDERLTKSEVRRLLLAVPDLLIHVKYTTGLDRADAIAASLELPAEAASPQVQLHAPARLTWRPPQAAIQILLVDQIPSAAGDIARGEALLQQLDQNRDGYLEKSEVVPPFDAQVPFAAVDVDHDEKIYPKEVSAFFQKRRLPLMTQVHARAEVHPDSLFAFLDVNADNQLTADELATVKTRLQALAASEDSGVAEGDIPIVVRLVLARGDLSNPDTLFNPQFTPSASPAGDAAPAWFSAMDTNGDNLISRLEFLGSATLFERLDRDESGFLTAGEVLTPPPSESKPQAD